MNACIIAYAFYDIDYRVRRYAEALASRGDTVDVIALRERGEKRHGLLNGVKIKRIQQRKFNEKGIYSYIFGYICFFIKASTIILFRQIRSRYKVIHIHNPPDFLVFVGLIPKLLGARIILDMHENLPEFYCTKFNKTPDTPLVRLLLFFEKISIRFADKVIAAHDLLAERIISRDGISVEDCIPILNYPNLAFFKEPSLRLKKDGYRIIYPGSISYHHGLDIAIKALAIVKKQLPAVRMDIYGRAKDFKYYNFLRRLISELDLSHNVKIFNPVPNEVVGKIISKASIGIVPKRADIFTSEAFSTKILDFMAAGIPIIASRTKIDEYYFNDSMIMFFEPENHQDLAKCILDLCKNPKIRKSLVTNEKQFINKNNWEVKKKVYYQIIDQLSLETTIT